MVNECRVESTYDDYNMSIHLFHNVQRRKRAREGKRNARLKKKKINSESITFILESDVKFFFLTGEICSEENICQLCRIIF